MNLRPIRMCYINDANEIINTESFAEFLTNIVQFNQTLFRCNFLVRAVEISILAQCVGYYTYPDGAAFVVASFGGILEGYTWWFVTPTEAHQFARALSIAAMSGEKELNQFFESKR